MNAESFPSLRKWISSTEVVLQLLYSDTTTAEWLFQQERATFNDARNAPHELENRSLGRILPAQSARNLR